MDKYFLILDRVCSLKLARRQIFLKCSINLKLLSVVILNNIGFCYRPADPRIIFKRPGNRKIVISKNTHTAEKLISVFYLLYLVNNICLDNFERLLVNMVARKIHTEELMN